MFPAANQLLVVRIVGSKTVGRTGESRFVFEVFDDKAGTHISKHFAHCAPTDEEILSTLAHEMAHVWQQSHGTPPRRSYHDRQWAAKMKGIGLQPSDTGQVGGKETGQSVSHYIIPEGPYAKAYAKLQVKGVQLHWQSAPAGQEAKAKKASKTKFTCPDCGQNAWAKPDALLGCYACYEETEELVLMLAEPSDEDEAPSHNQVPEKPRES